MKFTATEEYNNAARRVEDTEITNIKEEIKHEKQRMKHDTKRYTISVQVALKLAQAFGRRMLLSK